jgi:hypothetical protein
VSADQVFIILRQLGEQHLFAHSAQLNRPYIDGTRLASRQIPARISNGRVGKSVKDVVASGYSPLSEAIAQAVLIETLSSFSR